MNLGITIKNLRQQNRIKQGSFAETCGITSTYLSQIENDVKEPNLSTLKIISEKLGVPMPVLFFLSLESSDIKPERREIYNHLSPSINSMILELFPLKMINTPKHLAFELKVELQEMENIINNIDKYYYEKIEIKENKNGKIKKRVLNPSIKRLKVIQKRVLDNILTKLEIPDYAYGAIKGRDNVTNAKKHQGKKYIFTTDLKNFFPSINHRKVFEMFRSFNFSPTVSRLLTQLATYKGKLPQGAPTSPAIANLVFIKTGKKLMQFANENKITFTSFVDDLTFSAPIDFKPKSQLIITTLQADGFKISHKKTNYRTKLPVVTGVVVKNNKLDLSESFKIKLQNLDGKSPEQIRGLQQYAHRIKKTNSHKANNPLI